MKNHNILITGGSGFLGRAILARAEREGWRGRITIYSRDEAKHVALRRRFPDARFVLGDVRDEDRLAAACSGADVVVHAAAMKYIPEAEFNVLECLDVNIAGSVAVAKAALRGGVEVVVGLSTDKAAGPLNTYGMSKAVMERVFSEAALWGGPAFLCVRYGNVVSSTGSVVPEFRRQIREEGEVRVTDERMSRFWLSHESAVDLIMLAAASRDRAGSTFIPRCGAMRIMDLAKAAIGSEGAECPIREVGLRPGEKIHETLLRAEEASRTIMTEATLSGRWPLRVMELAPATASAVDGAWGGGEYVSSEPDFEFSGEEMLALIEEAAHV